MSDKKGKTNINVKADTDLWSQFIGLAKFLKIDKMNLLEQSIADTIKKHQKKGS